MGKLVKLRNKKMSFSILILLTLILVLICSFVLFSHVKEYRKYKTVESKFYYFYSNAKVDFSAQVTLNSKDKVLSVEKEGLDLTTYPIYYLEEKNLILPKNMEIVYPYKFKALYKLGPHSKLFYKGKYLYINSEFGVGRLYDCFLYDGDNLYVFVEPTVVYVGDAQYNLSELSYVIVENNSVQIYNKLEDNFIFLENLSLDISVLAYTNEYMVNLSNDTYEYKSSYYSLIRNVDGLDEVEF